MNAEKKEKIKIVSVASIPLVVLLIILAIVFPWSTYGNKAYSEETVFAVGNRKDDEQGYYQIGEHQIIPDETYKVFITGDGTIYVEIDESTTIVAGDKELNQALSIDGTEKLSQYIRKRNLIATPDDLRKAKIVVLCAFTYLMTTSYVLIDLFTTVYKKKNHIHQIE